MNGCRLFRPARAGLGLLLVFLAGCSADRGHAPSERAQASTGTVVARIGDRTITMAEVDRGIRLERHDLAEAEFRLRSEQLRKLIDSDSASDAAAELEWLLEPPVPPRLDIPLQKRDLRGNPAAPVTLAVFCSYQSPHCARLNPILLRLLDDYAGWLRLAHFDLPLRYHRQGPAATAAAFCARSQGASWRYADGLYAIGDRLVEDGFVRLAATQDLDRGAFTACLRDHGSAPGLSADRALASELGLRSVPVVFINGLYTRGPRPYEYYALWIDREMERLGLDPARAHPEAARFAPGGALPPETTLPLVLSGTSVSTKAQASTALISVKDAGAKSFHTGDALLEGVRLGAIRESHVLLDNRGRLERLSLRGEEAKGVRVPLTSPAPRDEETMRRIEQPQGEERKLVEPTAVLPLGREWLEEQLRNREELEKRFVAAEHQVDGHNLLKLEGIEDSEFFAALGLEEGDVVVRVNDTWVHSEQNQLWDALTSGQVVDVTFMRNGLPQRYQYVVEEKGYFESPEEGSGDQGRDDDNGSGDEDE